jgi:beta-glucosidase
VAKNIEEGKVGGLFNIKSVQKIKEVQRLLLKILKIPLLFMEPAINNFQFL